MAANHDPGEIAGWKEWNDETKRTLDSLRRDSKPFSISIVPGELRKWHENAYMPKAVSIGPTYSGARMDLLQMDETKRQCTRSFLHRPEDKAKPNLKKCREFLFKLEKKVCDFYPVDLKLGWNDLANIMLCDACFLLELLFSGSEGLTEVPRSRLWPPVNGAEIGKREALLTDLMVLENQIPIFILRDLCKELFPKLFKDDDDGDNDDKVDAFIKTLALNLFGYPTDEKLNSAYSASNLLDLVHSCVSDGSGETLEENEESHHHWSIAIDIGSSQAELDRCAPILEAAGVKIKPAGQGGVEGSNNYDRKFSKSNGKLEILPLKFDIKFSKRSGELEISPLHITKETKKRWLNLIAWEQGNTGFGCKHYCTGAACLFDSLICCEGDIQLLKDRGVIVDHTDKSNRQLLEFFRSVVKGVDRDKINDSAYWKMVKDLSIHSATNYYFKQFPTIMWHSKLPKALPGIAKFLMRGINIMLALISILSVVQTYYAVVSYTNPKN